MHRPRLKDLLPVTVRVFDPEEVTLYLKSISDEIERLNLDNARLLEENGRLARQVEDGLTTRCQNLIGLARRAGAAVCGFEKTKAALKNGTAYLLITARDGAVDGRAKLASMVPGLEPALGLNAAELGAVFGRERVVHVGVTDDGFAARMRDAFLRLERVRGPMADEVAIPEAAKVR